VALLPRFERAQDGAAQVCPIRRDGQRRAAIETLHARRRVGAQARGTSNQLRGRKRTRLRSRRKSINVRRRFVIVGRARHLGGIIRSGVRLCNASCIIAAALKSIESGQVYVTSSVCSCSALCVAHVVRVHIGRVCGGGGARSDGAG